MVDEQLRHKGFFTDGIFTFLKSNKDKKERTSITSTKASSPGKSKARATPPRPSAAPSRNVNRTEEEGFPDITLDEADMDADLVNVAKRKHLRINRGQILDEDIKLYCRDLTTGKTSNGILLDISPGGLLMVSKGEHAVDDDLLVSCHIGLNFRMKEQVRIRMVKGRKYGVEFIKPSKNTTTFLTQLYGAVGLGRPRTRNKDL